MFGNLFGKGLTRICAVGELPPEGKVSEISAAKHTFCVAMLNGKVSVLDNDCPHNNGPLGQGEIQEGKVLCPWHAYPFDLNTGVCDPETGMAVQVYEVTIRGDDVLVKL